VYRLRSIQSSGVPLPYLAMVSCTLASARYSSLPSAAAPSARGSAGCAGLPRFRTWRGACGGWPRTPWSPCRWSARARSGRSAKRHGVQVQRTVRLGAVQEDGDATDGEVRRDQREQQHLPPGSLSQAMRQHGHETVEPLPQLNPSLLPRALPARWPTGILVADLQQTLQFKGRMAPIRQGHCQSLCQTAAKKPSVWWRCGHSRR
jgi:hypothetical protein